MDAVHQNDDDRRGGERGRDRKRERGERKRTEFFSVSRPSRCSDDCWWAVGAAKQVR